MSTRTNVREKISMRFGLNSFRLGQHELTGRQRIVPFGFSPEDDFDGCEQNWYPNRDINQKELFFKVYLSPFRIRNVNPNAVAQRTIIPTMAIPPHVRFINCENEASAPHMRSEVTVKVADVPQASYQVESTE